MIVKLASYNAKVDTDGKLRQPKMLTRTVFSRALPGSAAVLAALTIPEFLVGADDLSEAGRYDHRTQPAATAGQGLVKQSAIGTKERVVGLSYVPVTDFVETRSRAISQSRISELATDTFSQTEIALLPIQPIADHDFLPVGISSAASPPGTAVVETAPIANASFPHAEPASLTVTQRTIASPITANLADAETIAAASLLTDSAALNAQVISAVPPLMPSASPAPTAASVAETPAISGDVTKTPVANALVSPSQSLADPLLPVGLMLPSEEIYDTTALVNRDIQSPHTGSVAEPAALAPTPALSAVEPAVIPQPIPRIAAISNVPTGNLSPSATGLGTDRFVSLDIKSQLTARVDGKSAGTIDFQQTTTGLLVRLGSLVEVLSDRYETADLARISSSPASNAYLSLTDLQAQGIPISYDPVYDEFNIGHTDSRPTAAHKVHIDQISSAERGPSSSALSQARR